MLFTFTTAITVLGAILPITAQDTLTINTLPNPTVCEPVQFTWSGGEAPYYMSLIPGGQPAAPAIRQFPAVPDGHSLTWVVDISPRTSFSTMLKDATGKVAYSDIQTVQDGPDNSCTDNLSNVVAAQSLAQAPANRTSSAASISKPTPAVSQGGVPTVVHVAGNSSTGASNSSGNSSTTSSTVAQPTRNGAGAAAGSIGIIGFLGFLGAALLG